MPGKEEELVIDHRSEPKILLDRMIMEFPLFGTIRM
jgi:hypothetical protein